MNKIELLQTNYVRSNRTIDTVLLTDTKSSLRQTIVYVYNYEGYHFRIFENIFEISNFLMNEDCKIIKDFDKEEECYKYLNRYKFIT